MGSGNTTLVDHAESIFADLGYAVSDDDGELRGTWRAEAEWVELLGDELTQTEFSQRVLETVEES